MKPERREQIEQLFASAWQRPAAERQHFLSKECGSDESLRREVESLLAARSQAGGFLERPAAEMQSPATARDQTRPAAGQTVGPYRLISPLGKGGMGEVWRAFDTRVGREVALKFCDSRFTERFGREARAIAALNHPNICQLYDVGQNYLVMELVEGESPAGRILLVTALDYARQVASALEAAHERGIIHRDLKPGNIKIRPDGTVKVLDFGLAKVVDAGQNQAGDSATVTIDATAAGAILGTPGYMSPEQVRGNEVDKRTDIWAFGVLLCEFLTGVSPFTRATTSDTFAAVLKEEPDFERVPFEARRLVRKCLEKDTKKRLRDIADAWELLERTEGTPATRRRSPWSARAGWIIAAVLAVAVIVAWLGPRLRPHEDKPLVRLDVDLGSDVAVDLTGPPNLIISPDGTRLAYVSRGQLFTQKLDEGVPRKLGGVAGAASPFFSPDGQWIGFFGNGKVTKISVDGGSPVDVCLTTGYFTGASWGEDGDIVAPLAAFGPLQRVPSTGGSPQPLTELDRSRGEASHRFPQVLPGGRAIIFTVNNSTTGFDDSNIDVLTLPDRRRKLLVRGGSSGRYLPSGHLIYINRGVLYAMPFDINRLEPRGKAKPVLEDVIYSPLFGSAQVDISRGGTLIYRTGGLDIGNVTVQLLDGSGSQVPLLAKPGAYTNLRLAPDGERAVMSFGEGMERGLWILDRRRDTFTALLHHRTGSLRYAIFTPDSRFLVFRDQEGLSWIRADGAGDPVALTTNKFSQVPTSFSPDGKTLAFQQARNVGGGLGGTQIWTVSVDNDGSRLRARDIRPFLQTEAGAYDAQFAPDGHWLAYSSDESGTSQVYVRAFPDHGRTWQISSEGGSRPRFSRRGELFFLNVDGRIMVVNYHPRGEEFDPGRARLWSAKQPASIGAPFWNYDVMPDGRIAALMVPDTPRQQHAQNHVIFVENFFDYLRRVAPPTN